MLFQGPQTGSLLSTLSTAHSSPSPTPHTHHLYLLQPHRNNSNEKPPADARGRRWWTPSRGHDTSCCGRKRGRLEGAYSCSHNTLPRLPHIQTCTHNRAEIPTTCSSFSPPRLRQVKEFPHLAITPGLHQAQPQSNPHPPQYSPSLDHMQSRTTLCTHDKLSESSDGEVSVDGSELVKTLTS